MANQFIIHGLSEEGKAYRAALVSIQELHKVSYRTCADEVYELNPVCDNCNTAFPCPTRKLADEALGGEERG